MRLSLFLLLLLPVHAISAPPNCDQTDLLTAGDLTGVCTSFVTTAAITVPPVSGRTRIFITGITGNVEIKHNITIDGGAGADDVAGFGGGNGLGGPGAHDGGGNGFAGPEDGGTASAPDGKVGNNVCISGGGGAGFAVAGDSGICPDTTLANNEGDAVIMGADFDFTNALFRGGFGGGAGDDGPIGGTLGAGGGGGGALHIEATGTITISSGITISARGGKGGNDTNDGGGGGGGSGGAIWLVSATGIINNGTIDVRGGARGTAASGGHGGIGKSGRFRLESAGTITNGTGVNSPSTTSSSASATKLSSDISCGTISQKDSQQNIFSVMIGFFLIFLLGFLSSLLKLGKAKAYSSIRGNT